MYVSAQQVRHLTTAIQAQLDAIGATNQVKLTINPRSNDGVTFRFDIEGEVTDAEGEGLAVKMTVPTIYQPFIGREFIGYRRRFIFIGWNPKAPQNPVRARCVRTGKEFRTPEHLLKVFLA